jgi:hypothetical protein
MPPQFRGYLCLFSISASWYLKYPKLAKLSYPGYSSQVRINTFKVQSEWQRGIDKLRGVSLISELICGSIAELTTVAINDNIDTQKFI